MINYKEVLGRLKLAVDILYGKSKIYWDMGIGIVGQMPRPILSEEDFNVITTLINEKAEFESRRDKLVPGSIWKCTASCTAAQGIEFVNVYREELVVIEKIVVSLVAFKLVTEDEDDDRSGEFVTDIEQFIVCNKPKEVADGQIYKD